MNHHEIRPFGMLAHSGFLPNIYFWSLWSEQIEGYPLPKSRHVHRKILKCHSQ